MQSTNPSQLSSQSHSKSQRTSLDQEIQSIADSIRSDIEKELSRTFKTFDVIEHHPLENSNPQGSSYAMRVRTDENDNSHLSLRTSRRDPLSNWVTDIDEFFRGTSPFDNLFGRFDPLSTGFNSIQSLANSIKSDVERDLNRTFDTFDVVESHPILTDPEHTSYFMKMKTDDNGHVRVKTIKKTPGSDWKTHVEEYNRGRPAVEGERKDQKKAVEGKGSQGEKMETENVGRREKPVEIEEEPLKGSQSHASNA